MRDLAIFVAAIALTIGLLAMTDGGTSTRPDAPRTGGGPAPTRGN